MAMHLPGRLASILPLPFEHFHSLSFYIGNEPLLKLTHTSVAVVRLSYHIVDLLWCKESAKSFNGVPRLKNFPSREK